MAMKAFVAVIICLIFTNLGSHCYGALQSGFYTGKCNGINVEMIVDGVIKSLMTEDRSIVAALLRMQFHDCFDNGCDASLLLDGSTSEKKANANKSVRGFDVIDKVKEAVEAKCPGVVSCADIIAMATRDSVVFSGGQWYAVETGRKDGMTSEASKVNLPSSSLSIKDADQMFKNKGFTTNEMVFLLGGGHTVGVTHCSFVKDRLYNFKAGQPDSSMNKTLLSKLRSTCPNDSSSDNNAIDLDQNQNSRLNVDNSYYQQLQIANGVLGLDQRLASDSLTKTMVSDAAKASDFKTKFGQAMIKLGALPGSGRGEIRKSCRAVNTRANVNMPPPPPSRKQRVGPFRPLFP